MNGSPHSTSSRPAASSLGGRAVVITRPAGTASALARQVRSAGGVPVLLPGSSLRAVIDPFTARSELTRALAADLIIFSSPAAVHFAATLLPLQTTATVLGVGAGTRHALQRQGMAGALAPRRQDSEGLLDELLLQPLQGCSIALIGAAGGRGLLREQLRARGACLREVHVYQRLPPRLDRRHVDRVLALQASSLVLFSSAEAVRHLARLLPPPALAALRRVTAVASSERLTQVLRDTGFSHIRRAASASAMDLLQAACSLS